MGVTPRFVDLNPALKLLILLSNLSLQVNNAALPSQRKRKLTGRQLQILAAIRASPSMAVIDLATYLHLHPSTVSGVIERLRRDGYLAISADRSDARRKIPRLTAAGRRVSEGPDLGAALQRAIEAQPPEAIERLADCLKLLVREIEATRS